MSRNSRAIALAAVLLLALPTFAQFKYSVTSYTTPGGVSDVVIGDFNRDGLPDFEVSSGSKLSFFRNLGGGKFSRRDLGVVPGSFMITADINNDGKLDIITSLTSSTAALKTLIGNGDGTFHRGQDITVGTRVTTAALGDINGDGKVDLVAINCTTSNTGCQAVTLLGSGTGTFTQHSSVLVGTDSYSVALADFNADGKLDLAVSATGPSRAAVYRGNGDGTFGSLTELVMDNPVTPGQNAEVAPRLAAADFNGDGVPDIVIGGGVTCGSACGTSIDEIWLSDGSGGFTRKSHVNGGGTGGNIPIPYDFNNDFKQDLLSFNGSHFGGGTTWYRGNGDGSLSLTSSTFNESDIAGYWPRDLNLDSRHDLVGASWLGGGLEVALNTNNTFNCPPPASDSLRAKICSPTSTASTSFQVRASGNSPAGVARLELWVDGTKRFQILNDQLRFNLTLSPGTHRIVVVAVDRFVPKTASTARSITVQ